MIKVFKMIEVRAGLVNWATFSRPSLIRPVFNFAWINLQQARFLAFLDRPGRFDTSNWLFEKKERINFHIHCEFDNLSTWVYLVNIIPKCKNVLRVSPKPCPRVRFKSRQILTPPSQIRGKHNIKIVIGQGSSSSLPQTQLNSTQLPAFRICSLSFLLRAL